VWFIFQDRYRRAQQNGYVTLPNTAIYPNHKVSSRWVNQGIMYRGGRGIISATVKVTPATPIKCRVLLYERISGRLLQTAVSDLAGNYVFRGVALHTEYFVVAVHPTRAYNLEGADAVYATPIPYPE